MGYSNRLWICPYYRRDYKDRMSCEGGRVQMPSVPLTREYMAQYCASQNYRNCTLARVLTQYYEKEI